eukprot:TRINITY_DN4811_c0_g1_i2.p1 TRINITY_DN4811_c0_g1~~TRINITY_DN4811_c0_g1_i2.p1  ORF type:complete len:1066 (+),score=144.83 TRINITY_DN4811_c0_g1_i2:49-3246(+)
MEDDLLWILEGDAESILSNCGPLLENADTRVRVSCALLNRLQYGIDSHADQMVAIMRLVSIHYTLDSCINHAFLELLNNSDQPGLFIHFIPTFFSSSIPDEIKELLGTLERIFGSDRKLAVPIIACLSELPLSPKDRRKAINMAKVSLQVVSESDIPAILASLIKSIDHKTDPSTIDYIRKQLQNESIENHSLNLEVFYNSLQANPIATISFYASALRYTEWSAIDVAVCLSLYSSIRERKSVMDAFSKAIQVNMLSPNICCQGTKLYLETELRRQTCVLFASNLLDRHATGYSIAECAVNILKTIICTCPEYRPYTISIILAHISGCPNEKDLERASSKPREMERNARLYNNAMIASDCLLGLCRSDLPLLVECIYQIEDTLHNSDNIPPYILHRLFHVFAVCCQVCPDSRLHHGVMIFVQKKLCSSQHNQLTAGLIASCHLLHNRIIPGLDIELLSNKLLEITRISSPDMICNLLDNIEYNYQVFSKEHMTHLLSHLIEPLLVQNIGFESSTCPKSRQGPTPSKQMHILSVSDGTSTSCSVSISIPERMSMQDLARNLESPKHLVLIWKGILSYLLLLRNTVGDVAFQEAVLAAKICMIPTTAAAVSSANQKSTPDTNTGIHFSHEIHSKLHQSPLRQESDYTIGDGLLCTIFETLIGFCFQSAVLYVFAINGESSCSNSLRKDTYQSFLSDIVTSSYFLKHLCGFLRKGLMLESLHHVHNQILTRLSPCLLPSLNLLCATPFAGSWSDDTILWDHSAHYVYPMLHSILQFYKKDQLSTKITEDPFHASVQGMLRLRDQSIDIDFISDSIIPLIGLLLYHHYTFSTWQPKVGTLSEHERPAVLQHLEDCLQTKLACYSILELCQNNSNKERNMLVGLDLSKALIGIQSLQTLCAALFPKHCTQIRSTADFFEMLAATSVDLCGTCAALRAMDSISKDVHHYQRVVRASLSAIQRFYSVDGETKRKFTFAPVVVYDAPWFIGETHQGLGLMDESHEITAPRMISVLLCYFRCRTVQTEKVYQLVAAIDERFESNLLLHSSFVPHYLPLSPGICWRYSCKVGGRV